MKLANKLDASTLVIVGDFNVTMLLKSPQMWYAPFSLYFNAGKHVEDKAIFYWLLWIWELN